MVSFFADVASEMLYPITPIFLSSVLGASLSSVGLVEGLAEALSSVLKILSGRLSDYSKKRKIFVFFGYLLAAISKPLIGLSNSWIQVLQARVLDRVGKGLRTSPRDAILADVTAPAQRGHAFGVHRSFDSLGAVVGPLLALVFLQFNAMPMRHLYYWALIPGLMATGLVLFLPKEIDGNKKNDQREEPTQVYKNKLSWRNLPTSYWTFLAIWMIFSLVNSSDAFIILKTKSISQSLSISILVYCGFNLIYAASSPYLGKLSDRVPRRYLLICGLFLYALIYLTFGLTHSMLGVVLPFLMYGLFMGATEGVSKALIVDLIPTDLKATGLGIFAGLTGMCTLIASTMAGFLWDSYGENVPFLVASAGAFISATMLLLYKRPSQARN